MTRIHMKNHKPLLKIEVAFLEKKVQVSLTLDVSKEEECHWKLSRFDRFSGR